MNHLVEKAIPQIRWCTVEVATKIDTWTPIRSVDELTPVMFRSSYTDGDRLQCTLKVPLIEFIPPNLERF